MAIIVRHSVAMCCHIETATMDPYYGFHSFSVASKIKFLRYLNLKNTGRITICNLNNC